MSRKRRMIIAAVGALTVVGAAAAVIVIVSVMPHSAGRLATRSAPGALSTVQQARLERQVTSPDISSEATVVAFGIRAAFVSRGAPLLPAGSRLQISPVSFRTTSAITAVVDATVAGPRPGRWRLLLVRQRGQWLLIGTRRLP